MVILFSTNGILAMTGDVRADLYSHQLPKWIPLKSIKIHQIPRCWWLNIHAPIYQHLLPIISSYSWFYREEYNYNWLVVWNIFLFVSIYWECHHPNWRTPSFFRVVGIPPTRWCSHSHDIPVIFPLMPFPWTPHQIIISQGRRRTTSDDVARSPSFTSPGSLQSTPAKSVGNSATRWSNTRGTAQLGLRWAMKS